MAKNGDRPQTVKELAEGIGAEPLLLSTSVPVNKKHIEHCQTNMYIVKAV